MIEIAKSESSLAHHCFLSGFQYIRVHVPGATESATVRNDFLCSLCSSSLQEDRKFRVLGGKKKIPFCDNFQNSFLYFNRKLKLNMYSTNNIFVLYLKISR